MRKASGDKRKGKVSEPKKPETAKSFSKDKKPFQKFSKTIDKPKAAPKKNQMNCD